MTGHVTATRPPPHGPATHGRVTCRVMCQVMWWVICQVVSASLTMGTYQGPLALGHSRRPLALWHPRPLFPLWLIATLSSWSTPFVNHGRWRPSSLGGPRPLAASNLRRPLAHGAPLATIGYQGVVIKNGRVIEPIVRGGGHSGRGGHGGLGGMSWWCGGMGWKWCGRKAKGHEVLLGADATGWLTPQGKARRGVLLFPREHAAHGHSFLG